MPRTRQELIDSLRQANTDRVTTDEYRAAYVNAPGKRPILDRKPVPWVGGTHPALDEWAGISTERSQEAEEKLLCIMCGLELNLDYVYSNFDGDIHDKQESYWKRPDGTRADSKEEMFMTFGLLPGKMGGAPTATFVHPRCALQAAAFCPHLKKQEFPAIAKDGTMLTHADLRRLANKHEN